MLLETIETHRPDGTLETRTTFLSVRRALLILFIALIALFSASQVNAFTFAGHYQPARRAARERAQTVKGDRLHRELSKACDRFIAAHKSRPVVWVKDPVTGLVIPQ